MITSCTNLRYFPRALMNCWCEVEMEYGFFAEQGKSTSVSSSGGEYLSNTLCANRFISTRFMDSEVLANSVADLKSGVLFSMNVASASIIRSAAVSQGRALHWRSTYSRR
ncbi:Uncharacterised protein [uncultured archaeon]|nr:Uncharacterised protein [uncultured archaeon]